MFRQLIPITCAALLGGALTVTVNAATSVEELAQLVREQETLLQERAEMESQLRKLRADAGSPGAMLTLEEQIDANRLKALELKGRELRLREQLQGEPQPKPQPESTKLDREAVEVQRLKVLLTRYYAEEEKAEAMGAVVVTPDTADRPEKASEYDPQQVLLNGSESISAINDMTVRLETETLVGYQRREVDMIYHIEVRRDGALVSSQSYQLKALGRAQYVGTVELEAGTVEVTVKTKKWSLEVTDEDGLNFLVTLSTPFDGPPELHLIPVQALLDTGWQELPAWLPYIGTPRDA